VAAPKEVDLCGCLRDRLSQSIVAARLWLQPFNIAQ
jgi:hypothetical protein